MAGVLAGEEGGGGAGGQEGEITDFRASARSCYLPGGGRVCEHASLH